jgi:hypothetical protein
VSERSNEIKKRKVGHCTDLDLDQHGYGSEELRAVCGTAVEMVAVRAKGRWSPKRQAPNKVGAPFALPSEPRSLGRGLGYTHLQGRSVCYTLKLSLNMVVQSVKVNLLTS